MSEEPAGRRVKLTLPVVVILLGAASMLIILPQFFHSSAPAPVVRSEVSTIDPAALVPGLAELPKGSSIASNTYVSTVQAARRNSTSLALLRDTGREIGYDPDFLIPRYGDIDVEVVRFQSREGMTRAYRYFLGLPGAQGLHAVRFRGLGERAALVASPSAGFVEFMRGRYYAVVTTVPFTRSTLEYIGVLARRLDRRIVTYRHSA